MPVPLPGPDAVVLTPPTAEEAVTAARGVASAVAPWGELTEFQRILIESVWRAIPGHTVDLSSYAPMTAEEFARFRCDDRRRDERRLTDGRRRGQEVAQERVTRLGEDRFGVELHALDRQLTMPQPHDEPVLALGGDHAPHGGRRAH